MPAYLSIRILSHSVAAAHAAQNDGQLVELKDRHGVIHKGYVRGMEYVMGIDAGWFVAFETLDDASAVADTVKKLMGSSIKLN